MPRAAPGSSLYAPAVTPSHAKAPGSNAEYRTRLTLPADQDRSVAGEVQPLRGRRGQVDLAAGDIGAGVDPPHAPAGGAVADGDLRPARQRLVGHAQPARAERPAAAEMAA